jgi:hypothetical protein
MGGEGAAVEKMIRANTAFSLSIKIILVALNAMSQMMHHHPERQEQVQNFWHKFGTPSSDIRRFTATSSDAKLFKSLNSSIKSVCKIILRR